MCFEETKHRYFVKNKSGLQHNQPLIKDKKFSEIRDKENQKYNVDYHNKSKNIVNQEINTTVQYETGKFTNNFVNLPNTYLIADKQNYVSNDRYQSNQANLQTNHAKPLTFGYVRNNGLKVKEGGSYFEGSNFMNGCQTKKFTQPNKNYSQMDRDKPIIPSTFTRPDKPLIERVADKKERYVKPLANKTISNNYQIDDFACTEQLDFKPVQKKPPPEKKHTTKFDFTKSKKPEKKSDGKDLKQFEYLQKIVNANAEIEFLQVFCQKQEEYLVNSGYIQTNQRHISWLSRAIVVDWMRQLSYEFRLQRNTFHIAVVLLDNYLQKTSNIAKSLLQAIGATVLFIASKLEEFQCKESQEFAYSTNNSCTVQDIHDLQIKITRCLKFRLNPPTFYDLANKIMTQWDAFLMQNEYAAHHPVFDMSNKVFFKQLDENSYRLFKEMMQLIDCTVIDIQTTQYKPRMLVCALMYLIVGKELKIYLTKQIVSEFPGSSLYLLDQHNQLNNLFRSFVEHIFGFSLFDILPVVQYAATFFDLKIVEQKPIISEEQDLQVMSLEEYCSFQTYNSNMIKTIKGRNRAFY